MATHTLILYAALVAILAIALASIAIWSRRELHMRLIALGLSLSMATVGWLAFAQLPGRPSDMTAEQFREKYRCATITPISIVQGTGIFMLVKKPQSHESEYLFVSWNMRLASSLQKSMRVAKLNGAGWIVYGSASCNSGDGDEDADGTKGKGKKGKPGLKRPGDSGAEQEGGDGFTFYPDPVPPMPEKNYGPLFEGPIVMPEHK